MNAVPQMPSGFDVPTLKKVLSARVRVSSHEKLENIVALWKERAKLQGEPERVVDAINASHVVDTLLAEALDGELAQFGGFARTDQQRDAQLKQLRAAHESQAKKK